MSHAATVKEIRSDALDMKIWPGHSLGDSPLLAICMASYNPDSQRLLRQLESITCQHYENWLLIISDDNSDEFHLNELEALCKLDPRRIRLYRHQQSLGFYHNFERALSYVPDNVQYIALADQDDEWYPEKLDRLVSELNAEPESVLVYSDMRIVSSSGEVMSNTYWQNRNNEYKDFNTVFIANTVTGAASLFKRSLLDVILPFPEPVGGAFHDHWVACCAMSAGKLAYVPEPLYDYIQYNHSVIGQCDFVAKPLAARLGKWVSHAKDEGEGAGSKWEKVYQQDCLRLQGIANTLKLRLPEKKTDFTLNLMNGGSWSAFKLLLVYSLNRLMRRTTNGAELGLCMGFLRGQIKPG